MIIKGASTTMGESANAAPKNQTPASPSEGAVGPPTTAAGDGGFSEMEIAIETLDDGPFTNRRRLSTLQIKAVMG
jgi:hypothetical protein